MKISTDFVDMNINIIGDIKKSIPLVFIHGFMGSMNSWDEIIAGLDVPIILIDIPGHGQSSFKNITEYKFSNWCNDFMIVLDTLNLENINLCGYSMGGRLAISFAYKYPNRINKLILESTTLGVVNKEERIEQYKKDHDIAKSIKENYLDFIYSWNLKNLFFKQKERNIDGWRKQHDIRINQNKEQLIMAIRYLGTGSMPSYWDEINDRWGFPILLLTGKEDMKYCNIFSLLEQKLESSILVKISDASHNVHLEKPEEYIDLINNFI